ncbi:MAG: hypothetical protein ACYDH4_10765 [Candidatus Cryosericum sp.]
MHGFFLYLHEHPSLWILGWPILTSIVTALFSETFLVKLPRPIEWMVRFMKGYGVDSRMVLALLRILIGGLSLREGFPLPPLAGRSRPSSTDSIASTSTDSSDDAAPLE